MGVALWVGGLLFLGPATLADAPDVIAVERMLDRLDSAAEVDWILQAEAMVQLADWGVADAARPLAAMAQDGDADAWLRGQALIALVRLEGASRLELAAELAGAPSATLRTAAVRALGLIGAEAGLAIIERALDDDEAAVRHEAFEAYARLRGVAALDAVAPWLEREEPEAVAAAVRALAHIDAREARDHLLAALTHEQAAVRAETAGALARLARHDAVVPLIERMLGDDAEAVQAAARQALLRFDAPGLEAALDERIGELGPAQRVAAVELLAERAEPRTAALVAGWIGPYLRDDAAAMTAAIGLLARVDAAGHQQVLIDALEHEDADVRRMAVQGLAALRELDLFTVLRGRLLDEAGGVRAAAFTALRQGHQATPERGILRYLEPVLEGEDRDTLERALSLLAQRLEAGDVGQAIDRVERLLTGEDERLRRAAADALAGVADEPGRERIAAMQGYLTRWQIVGPFPSDEEQDGFDRAYPPERGLDFAARYELGAEGAGEAGEAGEEDADAEPQMLGWRGWTVQQVDGRVPLNEIMNTRDAGVAYGVTDIRARVPVEAELQIHFDDSVMVWLNEQRIARVEGPGEEQITIDLRRGVNRLVVKCVNRHSTWSWRVRVMADDGRRIEHVTSADPAGE